MKDDKKDEKKDNKTGEIKHNTNIYYSSNTSATKNNKQDANDTKAIPNNNKVYISSNVTKKDKDKEEIKKVNPQDDKIEGLINNVNQPPFIPSNLNKNINLVKDENDLKEKENDSERDKESVSTSDKTSPCISEKVGKEKNFFSLNQIY